MPRANIAIYNVEFEPEISPQSEIGGKDKILHSKSHVNGEISTKRVKSHFQHRM